MKVNEVMGGATEYLNMRHTYKNTEAFKHFENEKKSGNMHQAIGSYLMHFIWEHYSKDFAIKFLGSLAYNTLDGLERINSALDIAGVTENYSDISSIGGFGCTDSDGGINESQVGTISGLNKHSFVPITRTDYCVIRGKEHYVYEGFCNNNGMADGVLTECRGRCVESMCE